MTPTLRANALGGTAGTQGALLGMGAKLVTVKVGPYEIEVVLSPDGRFLDVHEVRVPVDFRSPQQKVATAGYLDVDDLYKE